MIAIPRRPSKQGTRPFSSHCQEDWGSSTFSCDERAGICESGRPFLLARISFNWYLTLALAEPMNALSFRPRKIPQPSADLLSAAADNDQP
jgi:hypothetical protein